MLQSLWRQRRWLDLWRQAGATGAAIGGRGPLLRSLAVAQASRAIGDLAGMETLRRRVRARRNAAASHLSAGLQGMLPVTAPPRPEGEGMAPSLRFALANSPLPKYLAVDDRNSMAHGVESRVPFLDHRLVELALRLPLELQLWNGINKVAVRAALHGTVPAVVLDRRPKFGFPVDARRWFTGVLAGPLREILTDPLLARSGWIAPPAVERLLAEHRTGRHDHTDRLFALAQAAIWLDLQQQAR